MAAGSTFLALIVAQTMSKVEARNGDGNDTRKISTTVGTITLASFGIICVTSWTSKSSAAWSWSRKSILENAIWSRLSMWRSSVHSWAFLIWFCNAASQG